MYKYPAMTKTLGSFKLNIEERTFNNSENIVLLGENGTGKTSFVRVLAGHKDYEPDEKEYEVRLYLTIRSQNLLYPTNPKIYLLNLTEQLKNY
jgi:ATP-binding cassette subfamily E protein 1